LSLSYQKYGFGIQDPGSKRYRIPDPQHLGENLFKKVGLVVGPMRPNFIDFGFEEGRNQAKITSNGDLIMLVTLFKHFEVYIYTLYKLLKKFLSGHCD
jgi:hypothetical protein